MYYGQFLLVHNGLTISQIDGCKVIPLVRSTLIGQNYGPLYALGCTVLQTAANDEMGRSS